MLLKPSAYSKPYDLTKCGFCGLFPAAWTIRDEKGQLIPAPPVAIGCSGSQVVKRSAAITGSHRHHQYCVECVRKANAENEEGPFVPATRWSGWESNDKGILTKAVPQLPSDYTAAREAGLVIIEEDGDNNNNQTHDIDLSEDIDLKSALEETTGDDTTATTNDNNANQNRSDNNNNNTNNSNNNSMRNQANNSSIVSNMAPIPLQAQPNNSAAQPAPIPKQPNKNDNNNAPNLQTYNQPKQSPATLLTVESGFPPIYYAKNIADMMQHFPANILDKRFDDVVMQCLRYAKHSYCVTANLDQDCFQMQTHCPRVYNAYMHYIKERGAMKQKQLKQQQQQQKQMALQEVGLIPKQRIRPMPKRSLPQDLFGGGPPKKKQRQNIANQQLFGRRAQNPNTTVKNGAPTVKYNLPRSATVTTSHDTYTLRRITPINLSKLSLQTHSRTVL